MAVEVVDHDPAWTTAFEQVRDDLLRLLHDVPGARVEHVGSTAVPGLAAKPVVDVGVVVGADQVGVAVAALVRSGYVHRGDLGIPGREAFTSPDDVPRRHVYVYAAGSLPLRNHLAVRDALRADDALRDAYGALKRRLAAAGLGVDAYTEAETPFLRGVLEQAGLAPSELDDVERANRA
ncbi:MAG: GrpB family protein [Nocardioidaceae bacterium]|nr:GrpB family protein [Nocardioidaceae bacterium]